MKSDQPEQEHRDAPENRPHQRASHHNSAYRHHRIRQTQDGCFFTHRNSIAGIDRLNVRLIDLCLSQPVAQALRTARKQERSGKQQRRCRQNRQECTANAQNDAQTAHGNKNRFLQGIHEQPLAFLASFLSRKRRYRTTLRHRQWKSTQSNAKGKVVSESRRRIATSDRLFATKRPCTSNAAEEKSYSILK